MSGGVDSSVAALLLKQAGYEVMGVTMRITPEGVAPAARKLACYGEDEAAEIEDIEKVAQHLGIEFQVVDLRREYEERILNYFREEYARGRTPNPCVKCNAEIKFGLLLEGCRRLGLEYDYFATGHYARVRFDERSGRWLLLKARDAAKDQSYFLSLLSQEQLARSLFPLGELRKGEVRKIAREHSLPVSEKEESQDFYAGDYRELLPAGKPGPIKDLGGKVLGQHDGIENYTIGQRRGLGIASGGRLYVVRIEAETNTVYIGEEKDLLTSKFYVDRVNWVARVPAVGEVIEAAVRVRYRSPELHCRLIVGGGEMGTGRGLVEASGTISTMAGETLRGNEDYDRKTIQDKILIKMEMKDKEEIKALAGGEMEKSVSEKEAGKGSAVGELDMKTVEASVAAVTEVVEVTLLTPYKAVTPGQVAVFYEGELVLGAGFIR